MKRLLLAIALLLGLADVAAAQNVTCATRPVTDNSNACANTAFVNSYVNNPASPIYSTAHTWTATQTFAASSDLSTVVKSSGATAAPLTSGATLAQYYQGSSGTPITTALPSVAISRYENISTDTQGLQNPALLVEVIGNNSGGISSPISQSLGVYSTVTQNGIGDALGFGTLVTANGGNNRFAYGYFANIWAKVANTAAYGSETVITNDAGNAPYATGTTPYMVGAHYGANGTYRNTVGIYFSTWGTSGQQWDVGIAFRTGSIHTASLWDDSSSITTLLDKGSHTNGIDLSGATFSGYPFKSTGFSVAPAGDVVSKSITLTGSGGVLALLASNSGLEIGPAGTSNTPYIDFHSSASVTDYDARIIASDGTGVAGNGTLTVTAAAFALPAVTTINGIQAVSIDATQTLTNKSMSGSSNTFTNIPASAIVSAALTRTNDTNVTLTLGGSPTTALLNAASITVGWSGTLAASRGGFGADVSAQSGVPLFASGTPTFTSTSGSGNFVRVTSAGLTTPVITTNIQPVSDGGADLGTSSLRWATGYLNTITASGQAARTWSMARQTTAATSGQNLTIQAGGAVSGGTDLVGGNLVLSSGIATGSGGSIYGNGAVIFMGASSGGTTGTGDVSPTEVMRIMNGAGGYGLLTFRGTTSNGYAITGASGDASTYFNASTGGSIHLRINNTTISTQDASNFSSSGGMGILNTTAIPAGGSTAIGYRFSSTSNFGVFFGSGAPTLSAAKGSLYLRSDGSTTNDRMYVNTNGGTTWTAVITAI